MKPILFNTDMVRAILDGRKTVTRRVVKPQPQYDVEKAKSAFDDIFDIVAATNPPYQPGDILYVRETWSMISEWTDVDPSVGMFDGYIYKADWSGNSHPRWHPSIHMPREAARIFLKVTDVQVERLQESGKGWCLEIEKEGICTPQDPILYISDDAFHDALRKEMEKVWDSTINPKDRDKYGWEANPWVWVISFKNIGKPEATP